MNIDLNFTGVSREGGSGPLLEEGRYLMTLVDCEAKQKEGKSPTLHVVYEVGESKVRDFIVIHPNTLWRVRIWLEALTNQEIEGELSLNPKDLFGLKVWGNIIQKPREDKPELMQNAVESYEPVTD